MLATLVEDASVISYAASTAASEGVAEVNPAGMAKDTRASPIGIVTFGKGHAWKVQEEPVRETDDPSGHSNASSGQTIGCNGCSVAFRYTKPAIPTRIISEMPTKRFFIGSYYQKMV